MALCNCPLSGELPTITPSSCPFEIGQIQKVIVSKLYGANGAENVITGTSSASLDAVSTWTAFKAASDATKLIELPEVFNPEWTAGDEIVVGENSNETPDGRGIKLGEYGGQLGGNFSQQSPDVMATVKQLECWTGLGIYFVNQYNRVFGLSTTAGAVTAQSGTIKPIPIGRLSVKGYDGASLDANTKNDFVIRFTQGWADNLAWVDVPNMLTAF